MECTEANINIFSVEVLGHVLSWLGDEDLVNAASVNRHWFDVINQHLLRRKRRAILRSDASDFIPDWPLDKLSVIGFSSEQLANLNVCAGVTSLEISYQEAADQALDNDLIASLLTNCEQLKELSFKNVVPAQSTLEVVERCTFATLQSLTFECQSTTMGMDEIDAFFETLHFPEVKLIMKSYGSTEQSHFHARYPVLFSELISFLEIPERSTALTLDCSGLSKHAYSCLKSCKNLQSVELLNAVHMEDDAVEMLCSLPRLTHVRVGNAGRVTSEGWATLFRRRPNIALISLSNCAAASSDCLYTDVQPTSQQVQLDLQHCKPITKLGLTSLLRLPQSVQLTLDYNDKLLENVTDAINNNDLPVHLNQLDITIQRVHATSIAHCHLLNKIQQTLASYSKLHDIQFTYQELFTKKVYNCRQISTTTYLD